MSEDRIEEWPDSWPVSAIDEIEKGEAHITRLQEEVARLKAAIREHRDSFNKDMEEHDWTTEDEALWSLVEEKQDG